MLATLQDLQDLEQRKSYVNARFLWAIGQQHGAQRDQQLRELLHHTLLTNRLWLRLSGAVPYSWEPDSQAREARAAVVAQYQETHAEETSWLGNSRTVISTKRSRNPTFRDAASPPPAPAARASWAERRLAWIAFHVERSPAVEWS